MFLFHQGSPTGSTVLKLNPHQIADHEDNIHWYMHSCEANVGNPAGNLSIEILKSGEMEFRKLDITAVTTEDKQTSCEIHRKIDFGIEFTSDMENAIIRCKLINKFFPDFPNFYSNNETVLLIPGNIASVT